HLRHARNPVMSDELPTAARVADPGIRALYRLENRWQAWLDVEAALAAAQAELGIIPAAAAEAIARAAHFELLDRARLDEGFARTGHTIVPLVWELSRVVGEPHGGWVHWGATTQNITQTGDLLVLRQAHGIFLKLIGEALAAAADLAERGADMPIAGRTHGQHAVPATFGYKVAVWVDELIRHVERFRQAAPRIFVAVLGGGAGTYASLGEMGPKVQAGIAKQLGFNSMRVPSRVLLDHLAENICLLGMLAGSCGRIGREIYTLMKTEFGEVEEPVPAGTVGSSTMPQKRNPKLCQDIVAAAAESLLGRFVDCDEPGHGDRAATLAEASRGEFLAVVAPLACEIGPRGMRIHKYRKALGRSPLDRRHRACRHPRRRVRRLQRLRQHLNGVVAVIFPLIGQLLARPRLEHDLHRLVEAGGAFLARDSKRRELAALETAPGSPVDTPAGQHVEQGDLLGEPQRIVEGGKRYRSPDP